MRVFYDLHSKHPNLDAVKSWSPINYVSHLIDNLHARQEVKDLALRSNYMLWDMGICRGDVQNAIYAGITKNAMDELHEAQLHHFDDYESTARGQNGW